MKATLSLAVLCLLGEVSALDLSKHHRHRIQMREPGKFYLPTRPGAKWFELDDPTERIHGTEHMDDYSPYDPDVGDAPEDLKRVGNDHEPLVNPKLSPTGYYNGFFHKDYQGNYHQMSHGHKHQHKRRHHHHDHSRIQMRDHKNDTDDIVEDNRMVQIKDHENDTDDLPAGLDPYQLMQVKLVEDQKKTAQKWEDEYNQKEEDASFEFVQLHFDHENDTEDMPSGLDPIDLAQGGQVKTAYQLAAEEKEAEVNAIIRESGDDDLVQLDQKDYGVVHHSLVEREDDDQNVQLEDYGTTTHSFAEGLEDTNDVFLAFDSHQNDTDDIAEDQSPDMYDHHHSKMWNEMVKKKALELEQTIKIEDNIEESKVKAKEEAERRAAIVKFNEEQEKKKMLAQQNVKKAKSGSLEEQRKFNPYKTIDLSEVYSAMV